MNFGTRITSRLALLGAVSALLFASPSFAVEVAGVNIDETAQVGNQQLKLNGAGIRYKVIFKVYVAALYLAEKKTTTPEVLALPGAKRVTMAFLRDLSSEDLGQRVMDGIRKNADVSERAKIIDSMMAFGKIFALLPEFKKNDVLTVDWIPGTGLVVQYNGKKLGETIKDPNFYSALLRIWLGPNPADEKLKHLMLNDQTI